MKRIILFAFLLVACDSPAGNTVREWSSDLFRDPPPLPAAHFSILCDRSIGSTCGELELSANIQAALSSVAATPGSTVALFVLGPDLAGTRELARITVRAPRIQRERARRSQERAFIDASRVELLRAVQPLFASDPLRSSPLAEGITKIALSRPAANHTIIVVSDGLEFAKSTGTDMECATPKPEVFVRRLHARSLFTAGSMVGTRLLFVNQHLGAIGGNRCEQSIHRIGTVRAAWTAAGRAAGATVTFSADAFGGEQ